MCSVIKATFMEKIKSCKKQLESEKWIQAALKMCIVAPLVTSLLSVNGDWLQYIQQPNIVNELKLNIDLLGAYKDVKDTYEYKPKQRLD